MLPAPGQGALAVECRASDPALAALLGAVTDPASMAAVTAERSLLEALAAGCSAPVAAYAAGTAELRMRAAVMSADGRRVLRAHGATPAARARQLGRDLAAQLLRSGAADLISVNRNGARSPSRLGGLLPSPVRTGLRVGGKVNHRPLPCAARGRDHLDVVNLRRMRQDSSPSASARSPACVTRG
jgi:hypothetical protein